MCQYVRESETLWHLNSPKVSEFHTPSCICNPLFARQTLLSRRLTVHFELISKSLMSCGEKKQCIKQKCNRFFFPKGIHMNKSINYIF